MVAYSFQKRFIGPILAGLEGGARSEFAPKRQTIRAIGRRRHARPGETLQLYTAMRTKQCRRIGEARCVSVQDIRIMLNAAWISIGPDIRISDPDDLAEFARSDGFAGWGEMHDFWKQEHGDLVRLGPFVGVLIKWAPL
jgi:hypothetical protein